MIERIRNHYQDRELLETRSQEEHGHGLKLLLPLPEKGCVLVVLEDHSQPPPRNLRLHKYVPYTLLVDQKEGEIKWHCEGLLKRTYDDMFVWLAKPNG